ncbi:GAF domain-containing protein [bacterium]|nr:GAF domain-containing protein [bacterium]MCK4597019.1 GAF domain-containing protein [bacterium]
MRDEMELFRFLLDKVKEIVAGPARRDEKLKAICRLLKDEVVHYDWVGFYIADEYKRELNLGPFAGEPTEHTRIPFGYGVCGHAAEIKETFIVQDVYKESNYLPCSSDVRAEMVVPFFKDGGIAGELDIDSCSLAPFTEEDKTFLEGVCELVAGLF